MRCLIILFLILGGFSAWSQQSSTDFLFTIKTDNPGLTNSTSFRLNLNQPNINYLVDIDWDNDGVFDTLGVTNSITHNYLTSGTYAIRLKGQFPKLLLGDYKTNQSDRSKLISVDQWGNQPWTDVSLMFINCDSLLTTPLDTPDFSRIWALGSMFAGAEKFDGPVNHWDVSMVTTTNVMFYGAESFNQPMDNWDVSSIVFASRMFAHAKSFNSSLNNWNLTSAIDISFMFEGATSFNQSINSWSTPVCTSMFSMFLEAHNYNRPMDSLDVSNVIDFGRMFENASSFNQDISNWDYSGASGMRWFLDNSGMSTSNYDALLQSWRTNYLNRNLNVGALGMEYCSGSAARATLVQSGWQFNGDTLQSNCTFTADHQLNLKTEKDFYVFPNPSEGLIHLELERIPSDEIRIYNSFGQQVAEIMPENKMVIINITHFDNGLYFVQYRNQISKLVKK